MEEYVIVAIEAVSKAVEVLENYRDDEQITPEGAEALKVLKLCYGLLARTEIVIHETVIPSPEMLDIDEDDSPISRFGIPSSQLADFVFAITAEKGEINLRSLLKEILFYAKFGKITQKVVAKGIGIRENTISDFLHNKKSLTSDNYEKVINFVIREKSEKEIEGK